MRTVSLTEMEPGIERLSFVFRCPRLVPASQVTRAGAAHVAEPRGGVDDRRRGERLVARGIGEVALVHEQQRQRLQRRRRRRVGAAAAVLVGTQLAHCGVGAAEPRREGTAGGAAAERAPAAGEWPAEQRQQRQQRRGADGRLVSVKH